MTAHPQAGGSHGSTVLSGDLTDAIVEQLRSFGAELLQRAGLLLRVPQMTIVRAATIFQHFFYKRRSFAEFDVRHSAAAALALACKSAETSRTLHQIIVVMHRLQMRDLKEHGEPVYLGHTPALQQSSKDYIAAKKQAAHIEQQMLQSMGFELNFLLRTPHALLLEFLDNLDGLNFRLPQEFVQEAWGYLNDALRTTAFCAHEEQQIAAASVFLAARKRGVKLPSSPPWWELFDGVEVTNGSSNSSRQRSPVTVKEMETIAKAIDALYSKAPVHYIKVAKRKATFSLCPATPLETPPVHDSDSDEDHPGGAISSTAVPAPLAPAPPRPPVPLMNPDGSMTGQEELSRARSFDSSSDRELPRKSSFDGAGAPKAADDPDPKVDNRDRDRERDERRRSSRTSDSAPTKANSSGRLTFTSSKRGSSREKRRRETRRSRSRSRTRSRSRSRSRSQGRRRRR